MQIFKQLHGFIYSGEYKSFHYIYIVLSIRM